MNETTEVIEIKSLKKRKDPNDKINKRLFGINDEQYNANQLFISEGDFRTKAVLIKKSINNPPSKEIFTPISLDYSKYMEKIMAVKPRFDAFDREVCFACISEQVAGHRFTTLNAIYRNITGDTKRRRPTETMYQLIKSSLSKLTFSEITIDLTEVCIKYGYRKEGDIVILHSAIVPGKYTETKVKGQKSILVEFYEPSPLFLAAEIKNGQILTYDKKLLNVPIHNSPEIITIKAYILRRILEIMAHKMTPTITFNDVFEKNQLSDSSKAQKKRFRDYIAQMFDFWIQEKLISSYEIEKEGHIPISITFIYTNYRRRKIKTIADK